MVAVLENPEQTEELLQKMDAALAALPLDFEAYGTNYQQKTELLSELHQYAEGTYTIFPTPEAEPSFAEPSGHQMTMFDFLEKIRRQWQEQEQNEPEEEITAKTAEELAESWDEGVFEYQGYHFEAVGVGRGKIWLHRPVPIQNCIYRPIIQKISLNIRMMIFMQSAMHQLPMCSGVWKRNRKKL